MRFNVALKPNAHGVAEKATERSLSLDDSRRHYNTPTS
jgi:hypothetical protein